MKEFGSFFKRIKVKDNKDSAYINRDITQEIQICIEGNINLFEDKEKKIMQGAKQLLDAGKAENMEDAIITIACMIRGLKFKEKKIEDGKIVIVLRETATEMGIQLQKDGDEIEGR